jgi:hypothetical protein
MDDNALRVYSTRGQALEDPTQRLQICTSAAKAIQVRSRFLVAAEVIRKDSRVLAMKNCLSGCQ